jgi:hypothetical protein
MFPYGRAMHPTQNGQPLTYNYAWARKDENGNIVVLCHCECHAETKDERPDAVGMKLCQPCEDAAYQPWAAVVESLAR